MKYEWLAQAIERGQFNYYDVVTDVIHQTVSDAKRRASQRRDAIQTLIEIAAWSDS